MNEQEQKIIKCGMCEKELVGWTNLFKALYGICKEGGKKLKLEPVFLFCFDCIVDEEDKKELQKILLTEIAQKGFSFGKPKDPDETNN